ncbi:MULTISPECIES: hypothetical protein [unclassified Nitratiruptor]|uniref:hypothetical protein n=1 Tax=unclassified Nitratiruptor TaxID=2624044 RepID=UPI0019163730|nr:MULTISPECIES: hypothetical protein [unclassified Nitratiruptor]BCD60550.1 hypothetical protein NitYY0810_C1321 [Nitratiruptor sp. YY08-10]BCD64481.1 hypothetical protein NitYY0814_C1328 [Nitratiruptor sp. YY08-14]
MSVIYFPSNFTDLYLNVLDALKDSYFQTKKVVYEKIMDSLIFQLINNKNDMQKILNNLDDYIAKEDFSIIDDVNLEEFYSYIDTSKENLFNLLKYLENKKSIDKYFKRLYDIVDDLYTLTLQIDDRISTLESYRDIFTLKKAV